ncbi:chorismate mutase [Glycomyces terrestris]|nr:chorismate mutase [Glycomyces terrestris]
MARGFFHAQGRPPGPRPRSESARKETLMKTEVTTDELEALRTEINALDDELIRLWQRRAAVSKRIGEIRMANGGTRLVLDRERAILEKYRTALGEDGVQIAMLVLRAGRGPL